MITEGIIFGLTTMLCFGVVDFLSKKAVDYVGAYGTLFWLRIIMVIPLTVYLLCALSIPIMNSTTIVLVVIAGLLVVLGWFLYYKALDKGGQISIVAPIANSWPLLTTLIGLIILKESLETNQIISIILIFIGVILILTEFEKLTLSKKIATGSTFAILCAVSFGVWGFLNDAVVTEIGAISTVIFVEIITSILAITFIPLSKYKIKLPNKESLRVLAAMAAIEITGMIAFCMGLQTGLVSVISPIVATQILPPVILGCIFYKEQLQRTQKLGILFVTLGLIGISLI